MSDHPSRPTTGAGKAVQHWLDNNPAEADRLRREAAERADRLRRELAYLTEPRETLPAPPALPDGLGELLAANALPPARHGPDFRSVHWFGVDHVFSPKQAAVVGLLWAAWEGGNPDLSHDYLAAEAEIRGRVADVFRSNGRRHPAWGTMIQSQGRGTCRLQEPLA